MRVLIVSLGVLLFAALSGSCLFGGDDDGGATLPTATASLPTATATATTPPTATPTSQPTVEAVPTATPGEQTYTVQAGDSLSIIADRFGTTVDELLSLNEIEDPNVILVGQQIKLPPGATVSN